MHGNIEPDKTSLQSASEKPLELKEIGNRIEQSQSHNNSLSLENTLLNNHLSDFPISEDGDEFCSTDSDILAWNGKNDTEHPRNWSMGRKVFQTCIVSLYSLVSPMSSSIASPALSLIADDLQMPSPFMKTFSITVMILAWAIGPLIIAPLSESDSIGRRPVLNISIWVGFVFNLSCGFARTPVQLCLFRFLGGIGGCAPLSVGAGVLGDLWCDEERSVAISVYALAPNLGPILSPIISSFIIQRKTWPWIFFVLAIWNGTVALFGSIFLKETYSLKLLKDRVKSLRKETGNIHLHTIYEVNIGKTDRDLLTANSLRPLKLLFTHPMIIGLGSFMAFVYGFMYLMIITIPSIFREIYGFSIGSVGLMYIPLGIGFTFGTVFWTWAIDRVAVIMTENNNGISKLEFRLPLLISSGILVPVGLIWYGWSAEKKLHWIMPSIGLMIFGFALIAVFKATTQYLIMMDNRYSASSVAAAAVFRSLFGFSIPLFATPMYSKLNYGWGNTMCAFIAMALGIPFPVFCVIYGERLRKWSSKRMGTRAEEREFNELKVSNNGKRMQLEMILMSSK